MMKNLHKTIETHLMQMCKMTLFEKLFLFFSDL